MAEMSDDLLVRVRSVHKRYTAGETNDEMRVTRTDDVSLALTFFFSCFWNSKHLLGSASHE